MTGSRGPKPKPTAVRKAQGNPGRKKISENEPKPPSAIPTCPNHLTGRAKQEWRRIAPLLASLGLLTKLDRSTLAAYCQAYATWAKALNKVKRFGELIKVNDMGYLQQNPWVGIANKALDQMNKYITEFGLSPSARSRIQIDKDLLKALNESKGKSLEDVGKDAGKVTTDDLLADMDGASMPGRRAEA